MPELEVEVEERKTSAEWGAEEKTPDWLVETVRRTLATPDASNPQVTLEQYRTALIAICSIVCR